MNTYFIKRFIARTAVVLSAAALFCGCSDDDETSTLHFDKPEVGKLPNLRFCLV